MGATCSSKYLDTPYYTQVCEQYLHLCAMVDEYEKELRKRFNNKHIHHNDMVFEDKLLIEEACLTRHLMQELFNKWRQIMPEFVPNEPREYGMRFEFTLGDQFSFSPYSNDMDMSLYEDEISDCSYTPRLALMRKPELIDDLISSWKLPNPSIKVTRFGYNPLGRNSHMYTANMAEYRISFSFTVHSA